MDMMSGVWGMMNIKRSKKKDGEIGKMEVMGNIEIYVMMIKIK